MHWNFQDCIFHCEIEVFNQARIPWGATPLPLDTILPLPRQLPGGWHRISRFSPPLSQSILDKDTYDLKETYCFVINAIMKPKNLNINNGYSNLKCHVEVNIVYSL